MSQLHKTYIIITILSVFLFAPLLLTTTNIAGNYGDVYLHYYPMKYLVQENLQSGHLPLWNPYIFAGQPLLANPQSALFYPLSVFFYLLPLPLAFNYFFFIHFILAGLFFTLLLGSLGLRRTSTLIGAVAFTFSSFLVYKVPAGHPVALSGFIWLPAIMLLTEKQCTSLREHRWAILLGAALCLQFLSGHTFPCYISLVYIILHFVWSRMAYWQNLLIAGASCIGLCALQLIPTMELSQIAEMAKWQTLAESYSLPIKNIITIVLPNYFGNIINGTYKYPDNPSFFFERHNLYFGVIPAIFAGAGLLLSLRQKKFFYPIVIVAGLLLALGFETPLYGFLYSVAPGLGFLRVPARFFELCLAGLCVLTAIAWDRSVAGRKRWVSILLLLIVTADLMVWDKRFIYPQSMDAYRRKSEIAAPLNPFKRIITEPDRISANKSMMYHHYNLNGYEAILMEDFTRYLGLQERQALTTTGLARMDLDSPISKGFAAGYHVTLDDEKGKLIASYADGLKIYEVPGSLPRIFIARFLRSFSREDVYEAMDYLRLTKSDPSEELVTGPLPSGYPLSSFGGELLSFSIEPLRLCAEMSLGAPAAVVFSELYYPGWKAYAKKKEVPLIRGNKIFRAALMPAGEFIGRDKLYIVFHSTAWQFGLYVTLATLIWLTLLMV